MSSRLIEKCLDFEDASTIENENFVIVDVGEKTTFIVVDPYALNMEDVLNIKPNQISIVRVRRPLWGVGDVGKYIHVVTL